MSARHQTRLLTALAGGASLLALGYGHPAFAQGGAQPSASVGGLEEVVVTARRKEEKAQTVPIVMNTFAASTLQNEGVKTIRDLGSTIPSLSMTGTRDATQYLWLRGVIGAVQYFNEVPTINYGGYSLGFDLSNVQVLKGPQGTLFGQSADAGAILYVPHPTTNVFEGYVKVEAGDYGHRWMEGVVNVPIVDDKLVVRVGALSNHTDGWLFDVVNRSRTGIEDYWIARGTVTWRPTDTIQNDLLINYYSSNSVPNATPQWYVWNGSPTFAQYGTRIYDQSVTQHQLGWYNLSGGNYRGVAPFSSVQNYIITNTTRWDIDDNLTLKNIAGYQLWDLGPSYGNQSANVTTFPLSAAVLAQLKSKPITPVDGLGNGVGPEERYTEEAQLQGKVFDDKLSYTTGVFLSRGLKHQPLNHGPTYNAVYTIAGGSVTGNWAWGSQHTIGLFAQGTYDLSAVVDGLSFTAGYRYTWDHQTKFSQTFNGAGVATGSAGQVADFKAPSYNLSLDYQITPNILLYGTMAKGYSQGGFNAGNAAFDPRFTTYTPESLNNFEIGIKADYEVFGIKARTNLAAFHSIYNKVQGITTQLVANPTSGILQATNITTNAATATIEGFDGEVTVVPTDDLSVTGAFGYVHFHYDTWINPYALTLVHVSSTDWSGVPQYYTPALAYNIRATYKLPLLEMLAPGQDLGQQSLTATYTWNGHVYAGLMGPGQQSSMNIAPSYDVVTLNFNWRDMFGKTGLDGRLYATNLLENVNFVNNGSGYFSYGTVGRVPYIPRQWGFSLQYNFGE